jgi:hypothetical protein
MHWVLRALSVFFFRKNKIISHWQIANKAYWTIKKELKPNAQETD